MVDGGRQVFGAVARTETDITALIQRTLETVGRTDTTEVTQLVAGFDGSAETAMTVTEMMRERGAIC
jgi:hypothetical protein